MVDHLHGGANTDQQQERNDENRNRAAQNRLSAHQAPISGFGNRLRQPFDRIGSNRRTRRFGVRHCLPPFGQSLTAAFGKMCRISPESS